MRTNNELTELRQRCTESIMQDATLAPGIHVKQIGYEVCMNWLNGGEHPLVDIPTGNPLSNGRNSGPQYERGILMALDEVAPVELPNIWIDPEFLEYLNGSEPITLEVM